MKVGLTYDLRDDRLRAGYGTEDTAELDSPETIAALATALENLGHEPDRIGNLQALVARLAGGERWDVVFNIAEGFYGLAREAQVPALLDAYRIPYTFSEPLSLAVCLHKGWTKRLLRAAGIRTGDFVEVESPADVGAADRLGLPLFVKPIAEGTSKGIGAASVIHRREDLRPACQRLLARFRQAVLVEEFLPGRELTVGIVGTGRAAGVLGTLDITLRPGAEDGIYSFLNKERCEELVEYGLAPADDGQAREAAAMALAAWRALACRDAGRVDVRLDAAGRPQILEINPLPGLHPTHSDLPILCTHLGVGYGELIRRILASALSRKEGSLVDAAA
jgi:D-alanine-D-alanine ligase